MFVTKKRLNELEERYENKLNELNCRVYELERVNDVLVKLLEIEVGDWCLGTENTIKRWNYLLDYLNIEYKEETKKGYVKKK